MNKSNIIKAKIIIDLQERLKKAGFTDEKIELTIEAFIQASMRYVFYED